MFLQKNLPENMLQWRTTGLGWNQTNGGSTGFCITAAIWHHHKPISQWQGSFHLKTALPLVKMLVTPSDWSRNTSPWFHSGSFPVHYGMFVGALMDAVSQYSARTQPTLSQHSTSTQPTLSQPGDRMPCHNASHLRWPDWPSSLDCLHLYW